jgi:transcriptional regulator with XRE-family HTH domain
MKPWSERIADLQRVGWSLTALASVIGCSPQALSDIKQGRSQEPRGMAAVRLHNLHSTGALPPVTDESQQDRHRTPAASAGATAEATPTVLNEKVA